MSIFEPIQRESRAVDTARDQEVAPPDGSFDPRSIKIAGVAVAAIVALGLIVSDSAEPERGVRPAVATRVDPGAAAVEQAELKQSGGAPTPAPSASASTEPREQVESDADDASAWQAPDSDESEYDGWKRDDKPGNGNGNGNGWGKRDR